MNFKYKFLEKKCQTYNILSNNYADFLIKDSANILLNKINDNNKILNNKIKKTDDLLQDHIKKLRANIVKTVENLWGNKSKTSNCEDFDDDKTKLTDLIDKLENK